MAVFKFTSHLQSFVNSAPGEAAGETVGVVLSAVLEGRDQLKSYILDEQGRLRRHVMIFVDGKLLGVYGQPGRNLGEFGWIHAIACPSENEIWVGELINWRVQKLTLHPERARATR